jgi:hypothetical protein
MATVTETYKSPDQMFREAQVRHAIEEFDRIDSSRRSAKMMKVVGTLGLFGLGLVAAGAALAVPYLAAPTATAVMALAVTSGAGAGISGVLDVVGIVREAFNKRQLKKVRATYDLGQRNGLGTRRRWAQAA